jgi:hypothetical protein
LVSVSLLCGVTTAATPTALTITTNNATPAVNRPFTLSGTLTADGTPLSGRSITLNRLDPSGYLSAVNTTTTDATGAYAITRSEPTSGRYSFQAAFYGGDTYTPSTAALKITVGTLTPTALTITTNNATPAVNRPFTLSGTLTADGTPLSGRSITLNRVDPSGHLSAANTTTTDATGAYAITRSEPTPGSYSYQAVFNGDGTSPPSTSVVITRTVGTRTPSALSITTNNATPAVNRPFTLSGTLTAGTTPLSGRSITLNRKDPSGHLSAANTTTTDATGAYAITRSEPTPGSYSYQAVFSGDGTSAPSTSVVITRTVG